MSIVKQGFLIGAYRYPISPNQDRIVDIDPCALVHHKLLSPKDFKIGVYCILVRRKLRKEFHCRNLNHARVKFVRYSVTLHNMTVGVTATLLGKRG